MNKNEILEMVFDRAMFFENTADYMNKIGNTDLVITLSNKYEGVMSIIESLDLVDKYEEWKEKGEL